MVESVATPSTTHADQPVKTAESEAISPAPPTNQLEKIVESEGTPPALFADQLAVETAESEAAPPAPSTDQTVVENEEKKLKYLDFVQVFAIYVVVCYSTLYEYAKENSGPLKPGVQTVERAVKTVIGPLYQKFCSLPFRLLEFVYRKLDNSITELDHHAPAFLKDVSRHTWAAAQAAPGVARDLASEVHCTGLVETASRVSRTAYATYEPAAYELYDRYEPVATQYAVTAWRTLNRLPLFSQVAHIMIPTAAYWAEKYNKTVAYAAERGYAASYYLPLVPTERIAKTFQGAAEEPAADSPNGLYCSQ